MLKGEKKKGGGQDILEKGSASWKKKGVERGAKRDEKGERQDSGGGGKEKKRGRVCDCIKKNVLLSYQNRFIGGGGRGEGSGAPWRKGEKEEWRSITPRQNRRTGSLRRDQNRRKRRGNPPPPGRGEGKEKNFMAVHRKELFFPD